MCSDFTFHCYILIPRKCLRKTLFQHTVPRKHIFSTENKQQLTISELFARKYIVIRSDHVHPTVPLSPAPSKSSYVIYEWSLGASWKVVDVVTNRDNNIAMGNILPSELV